LQGIAPTIVAPLREPDAAPPETLMGRV